MAADQVREVLAELSRRAEQAGSDPEQITQLLDETTEITSTTGGVHDLAKTLVERAILAGVSPRELYERPFSGTFVRKVYNELRDKGHDLPELTLRGPRRRRKT